MPNLSPESRIAPAATRRPPTPAAEAIPLCNLFRFRERNLPVCLGQLCRRHRAQRCPTSARPRPVRNRCEPLAPGLPVGPIGPRQVFRLLRLWRPIPRCVCFFGRQLRHGGTFLFPDRSRSLLAEPPTGAPLRGRGAVGSSLEGIPPTVPSPRSAPPPRDERAIPLLTK